MADSEKDALTEQERKLIQTLLTMVWLSMDWNQGTGLYETNNFAEESPLTMSREEMNALANAIN